MEVTGYSENILKYAADNSRAGALANADGTGEIGLEAGNIGKQLAVRFALRVATDRVSEIRFQVFGCGFTMAACAAAAELAEGLLLGAAAGIDASAIDQQLGGLPAERGYCADLAAEALQAAVRSVDQGKTAVQVVQQTARDEHAPRLAADDPLYLALLNSSCPAAVAARDRRLFAALLTCAAQEPHPLPAALGLGEAEFGAVLNSLFPEFDSSLLQRHKRRPQSPPPEHNPELLQLLLSHLPATAAAADPPLSLWLAKCIAARAAHPGHLWTAMGFFRRPELTAAIRRHLPSLAAANNRGMRWKRYLFKQICDQNGGTLCAAPNCDLCSDYPLCFAPEND
jgi:nitrogen fixation protein NifQ